MFLDSEDLKLSNVVEEFTGVNPKGVYVSEEKMFVVCDKKDYGKVIGKQGFNIKKLSNFSKKIVEVIEFFDDPKDFLKSLFKPAQIIKFEEFDALDGGKGFIVEVPEDARGLAIGRGGEKIKKAKFLCKKLFKLSDVRIRAV
ncbi:NusA-like KH domain protein [uncultured archaeon]|nr:NusA-like KH domain protein [uncultured archaeon]